MKSGGTLQPRTASRGVHSAAVNQFDCHCTDPYRCTPMKGFLNVGRG